MMVRTPDLASRLSLTLVCLCLLALTACGFHLKGATPLPFKSLYTNINLESDFGARLKRAIQANSPKTALVGRRTDAEAFLHEISDDQHLREVSIDADGRVEEYELTLTFSFELLDDKGHVLLAPTTLTSVRELPYNERVVQAKDSEITRTFRDMRNGLIDQILRRISSPEVHDAYRSAESRPTVPLPDESIEHGRTSDNPRDPNLRP